MARIAALTAALFLLAGTALAEDEADHSATGRKVKSRAMAWWKSRARLTKTCPRCRGSGTIRYRREKHTCPKCKGTKVYVSLDTWRECFFAYRSPTHRREKGARLRSESEFREAVSDPEKYVVEKFKVAGARCLDADHALVFVTVKGDLFPREQRWVREDEEWWLWSKVDGWPGDEEAEKAEGKEEKEERDAPTRLSDADLDALSKILRKTDLAYAQHGVKQLARSKQLLLLLRFPHEDRPKDDPVAHLATDAVSLTRAVLNGMPHWAEISITFERHYRNRFGEVEYRPMSRATMTRAVFDRIQWKNLTKKEQAALFTWKDYEHVGWVPWN